VLDWLIIGGGVQGTYLSHWLAVARGVPRAKLRVLDPHEALLERWRHCTRNTGVDVLRSPFVHHLDLDAGSLQRYSRRFRANPQAEFTGPYLRPSLALFEEHSDWVLAGARLGELRVRGKARGLTRVPLGWRVETDAGSLEARQIVLALGHGENLAYPDWAGDSLQGRIRHVFDPEFRIESIGDEEEVAIVGGGMSAVQCALLLMKRSHRAPSVLSQHPLRVFGFDQDPCWLGPKCLGDFDRLEGFEERRLAVRVARQAGSMPQDLAARFTAAVKRGRIQRFEERVDRVEVRDGRLRIHSQGTVRVADRLILATGFQGGRPGGAWLDRVIESCELPLAPCGFPALDPHLGWVPGLAVIGGLAELRLGPSARNMGGMRMAAAKIAA
jgi:hypothetical protein